MPAQGLAVVPVECRVLDNCRCVRISGLRCDIYVKHTRVEQSRKECIFDLSIRQPCIAGISCAVETSSSRECMQLDDTTDCEYEYTHKHKCTHKLGLAVVSMAPPRATQQTTQNPTRASPHACRTAPADLLHADYMPWTGLGRRSMGATLDGSAAVGHGRITIMLPVCGRGAVAGAQLTF